MATRLRDALNELPLRVGAVTIPQPVREHRFHRERKWRFDYAFPAERIALECDGGIWTRGRHSRGAGQIADMEKLNEAALLGWLVLRCTPQQVRNGQATILLRLALDARLITAPPF